MELAETFLTNFGTLLITLIAYKSGVLRFLINGKYWNGQKTTEGKIDELTENHFHELKEGINAIQHTLHEIQEYGIKIRK